MMEFKVTTEHIGGAVRGQSSRCPVALALASAGAQSPLVGQANGEYRRGGRNYFFTITGRVRNWINAYDQGEEVLPFNGELVRTETGGLEMRMMPGQPASVPAVASGR